MAVALFFRKKKTARVVHGMGRHDHDYCLLTDVDCALADDAVPISSSSRFGVLCCVVLGNQSVCDMRSDSGVRRVTETRPRANLDTGPASSLRHATRSAVARQRRHVCIRLFLTVFGAFGVFSCGFYSLPWFFTVGRCGECVFQGSLGLSGKNHQPRITVIRYCSKVNCSGRAVFTCESRE